LAKIPTKTDTKMSYVYDAHVYHYSVSSGVTYICLADEAIGRRIPFSFLEDVRERFLTTYGAATIQNAHAYQMQSEFSRVLSTRMEFFSNDAGRLQTVQREVEDLKSVMVANIEKVLERGDKIDLLVGKAEDLNRQAMTFMTSSRSLKSSMWKRHMKLVLSILFLAALIIYFVLAHVFSWWPFAPSQPAAN
jgi:vesicle-associated membrane protein 7